MDTLSFNKFETMAIANDHFELPNGTTVSVDAASADRVVFTVTPVDGPAESFVWQAEPDQIITGISTSQDLIDAVNEYKRRNTIG